jgi:hypothetical protein
MDYPQTVFDRWFGRPRHPWLLRGAALGLLMAPVGAAALDGALPAFFGGGGWRILGSPAIIAYILAVAPSMARMEPPVVASLRAIARVDDKTFGDAIARAHGPKPVQELLALGLGGSVGFALMLAGDTGPVASWLQASWIFTTTLLYALLAWTIFVAVSGTRLTRVLLGLPLHVDPLDPAAFQGIGRNGLLSSLVFMGGITLSLAFVLSDPGSLRHPAFWLVYLPLALVPVMIFFLTMLPAHRVLSAAKQAELARVRQLLRESSRTLMDHMERKLDTGDLAASIQGLAAFEGQLRQARTWPYDTGMLRTLFFSILVPGATIVARVVVEVLFRSPR